MTERRRQPGIAPAVFGIVLRGSLHHGRARAALAIAGIALGVALGVAVHHVNHSARVEFASAMARLSGDADLSVRGGQSGLPEEVYPLVARTPGVEAVSPLVEGRVGLSGFPEGIAMLGIDPLRAVAVQPALFGQASGAVQDLLGGDAALVSAEAARIGGLVQGDEVTLDTPTGPFKVRIAGVLPAESFPRALLLVDIAAAQWRLDRLGRLDRIDVRGAPGTDADSIGRAIGSILPPGVHALGADADARRSDLLTRAYRINLDMLALVALITGGFLVYASQALSVLRRRAHFALLRALGVTRSGLTRVLVAEGALLGVLGSVPGIVIGLAAAGWVSTRFGVDLGAGYFDGARAALHVDWGALAVFGLLGTGAAALGALGPSLGTARIPVAEALRGRVSRGSAPARWRTATGLVLLAAGSVLAFAPPVGGLPVFGYLAIATLLLGTVALLPIVVRLSVATMRDAGGVLPATAIASLRGAPERVGLSLGAIVVSFSLMVSMLIMIASFRTSLEAWLGVVLPADLYLRSGVDDGLGPDAQRALEGVDGIGEVRFVRYERILLSPASLPVTLIARDVKAHDGRGLPLIGPPVAVPAGAPPPAWISEAVRDLHAVAPGQRLELPIGNSRTAFTVAGVWRDYGRQGGAVLIERTRYIELTGDARADDAWIWFAPGAEGGAVAAAVRAAMPRRATFELREPAQIRAASLRAFDRTFAVTYLLQALAVVIGLFGVAATFSAEAIARRAEFGALRHVGMTRGQVTGLIGLEGGAIGVLGAAIGFGLGRVLSLILVHVVNRQSFHWSLDTDIPWAALTAVAAALVLASAATAMVAARAATTHDAVRAVREEG